jgi:recombination protein RecT
VSTQQLRAATQQAKEPKTFLELIEVMKPEMQRALPRHLNAERMARIATTEYRKNPKLGECNITTVFGAIITLSQLGLEPGVLGQAYLIPYKGTCTAVPGWQGMADLVARAGRASVWTGAVYEGDTFDYAFGDRPHIHHVPNEDEDAPSADKLTHVYAVGRIKGAEWPIIEVWSRRKVEKHRDRFNKVGSQHYSYQHFEMYARKVALLQVIKYMPKSVELQTAVDVDNASQAGVTIDMKQASQGWVPPSEPDAPQGDGNGAAAPAHDKKTGELITVDAAVAELKKHETLKALEGAYDTLLKSFQDAKQKVPDDVERAYVDRKLAIEQKM